ncbi:hypothetical protein Vretimale_534 [Volvox reticuliferus]|uniref:Uncharacterized protein n=1 Tax=Volvox reticuliferus TaxID=1737510 RepID=A0A8J4C0X7_9CHLO|nr:hypothetical protein Vretifemale_2430 [Volvox reticuliferus]GIL94336.1 hypothetical protein Vretimale_534 [Volvox reticuliferus]
MPVGVEHTGYRSTRSTINAECASLQCPSRGNGEILLSKTSLGHDCADPSSLVGFIGGPASAECIGSRISASFLGEPATPNGAGDFAISYSPVSNLPIGRGYPYGQAATTLLPNNSFENSNLARRSCSFESDGPAVCTGHSAPVAALRQNRFLSSAGCDRHGAESALSATMIMGTSASYLNTLPTIADCHVVRLEQELQNQCAENNRLRQQVQERDEQLFALRAELRRLQGERGRNRAPPDVIQEEEPSGLLVQLQRAREKLVLQGIDAAFGRSSHGCVDVRQSIQSDGGSSSAPGEAFHSPLLLRLDTPPRAHAHESLPFARALSDDVQAPPACLTGSPALSNQPQEPIDPQGCTPAVEAPNRCNLVLPATATDEVAVEGSRVVKLSAVDIAMALDSSPELHPVVVAERQRTDRAHAALLFSSRQAARLAKQLTEAKVRAEALYEELRDWRRACLDNHKELVKYRRVAAAAAMKT